MDILLSTSEEPTPSKPFTLTIRGNRMTIYLANNAEKWEWKGNFMYGVITLRVELEAVAGDYYLKRGLRYIYSLL